MASKTRIHKLDDCDNSINSAEKIFFENVQKCKMYNPLLFNPVLDSDQTYLSCILTQDPCNTILKI